MAVAFKCPARRPGLMSIPNGLSWAYPRVRRRAGRVEGGMERSSGCFRWRGARSDGRHKQANENE